MKTNYLLPHRWMRVGVWVLIATLAAGIGFFAAFMYIAFTADDAVAALAPDTPFIRTAHLLMGVLTGLGILLTAFSRERVEDEMIVDLRNRSILTVACPAFLLYVVMQMIGSSFHGDGAARRHRHDYVDTHAGERRGAFGVLPALHPLCGGCGRGAP